MSAASERTLLGDQIIRAVLATLTLTLTLAPACAQPGHDAEAATARALSYDLSAIDRVWSAHSVRFALVTTQTAIFVAYYDANRQLTVASRPREGSYWLYHKLDSWTGWDSHNYIAMAVDPDGRVHVIGNLHNDPLNYFRSAAPGDVRTLTRIARMTDERLERRMTYPIFLRDPEGRLILKYRDGGSGAGDEIYNIYDPATQSWRPLLTVPLADGEGERNAYFVGPVLGPDGYFHLTWVWRETPDAATNHDLSYARSRDLVHWERSDGAPLALPITLASAEIVDAVPVGAGMINNNTVLGFDPAGRPMITFHKFDANGNTQVYVARRDPERWSIVQVSDWKGFRWDFGGSGSLDFRLGVRGAVPVSGNRVRVSVVRDSRPIDFLLDATTLALVEERPGLTLANQLRGAVIVPEGMQLNTVQDREGLTLAWPARPPNRDLAAADIPQPTILYLVSPH